MADGATPIVFLSHTSSDVEIAHAIRDTLESLFGRGTITVSYSTSKDIESGIASGEDWFQWITRQVRESRVTLVLLTPASIQKPWILWETGAVYGAAAVDAAVELRRIWPLIFGINVGDVPSPLQSMRLQARRGDRPDDVRVLLNELVQLFQSELTPSEYLTAAQSVPQAVESWVGRVETALTLAPLVPTEPAVQEWISRLEELAASGNASDVGYLHDWMKVAFGRQSDEHELPLDPRLHRRLGELYSASKQYDQAAAQFLLARRLAPRDIYTMRFLGKAYLDAGRLPEAGGVIADIDKLDATAAQRNAQCAALKGRWLIASGRQDDARDVYQHALDANPTSYYLADLLGQVLLAVGDREAARNTYRRALTIIESLDGERGVWPHATAATAAIVADDLAAADRHLSAIRALEPTAGELATIERGLATVQEQVGLPADDRARLRAQLRGA